MDGVIFDKDGTLFDFRKSWGAWAAGMLGQIARSPDHARELGRAIGYDLDHGLFHPESPVIAATNDEIALEMLPLLPGLSHRDLTERLHKLAADAPMVPAVDLPLVLGQLRALGLKIGLATNDSEAAAHAHLRAHGVDGYFDMVLGADSGHGAKPGSGMLRAFAHHFALTPARVAMVGDSRHDLVAGRAAGMVPVAVLTGIAEARDLADLAEAVLPDIAALPAWIRTRAAA